MYNWLSKLYSNYLSTKKDKYIKNLVSNGLKLGKNVEIIDAFFFDPSHCYLITIGDNTTICPNVRLIAHDASTKRLIGYTKIGKIEIGKNCFIGDSTIILPNVKIGENTVIGAGSVVTNDIPRDTVAAGNPANVITTIPAYREKLEKLQKDQKTFGPDYLINNLDARKRKELVDATNEGIHFII